MGRDVEGRHWCTAVATSVSQGVEREAVFRLVASWLFSFLGERGWYGPGVGQPSRVATRACVDSSYT